MALHYLEEMLQEYSTSSSSLKSDRILEYLRKSSYELVMNFTKVMQLQTNGSLYLACPGGNRYYDQCRGFYETLSDSYTKDYDIPTFPVMNRLNELVEFDDSDLEMLYDFSLLRYNPALFPTQMADDSENEVDIRDEGTISWK